MKGTGKKKKSREITVDLSEGRSFYEEKEKGALVFQVFIDSFKSRKYLFNVRKVLGVFV